MIWTQNRNNDHMLSFYSEMFINPNKIFINLNKRNLTQFSLALISDPSHNTRHSSPNVSILKHFSPMEKQRKKSDDPVAYISLLAKKVDKRSDSQYCAPVFSLPLPPRNLWSMLIVPDGFVFVRGIKSGVISHRVKLFVVHRYRSSTFFSRQHFWGLNCKARHSFPIRPSNVLRALIDAPISET